METPIAFDALALGRLPERHARYRPRHTAVIAPSGDRDVRLSWRELDAYVNRWANALAAQGTTMFPAFMQGATFIVHRRFDAEAFIDTVERERVTHTMLVPSQIIAILNARGFDPARLASLESCSRSARRCIASTRRGCIGCCPIASTSSMG